MTDEIHMTPAQVVEEVLGGPRQLSRDLAAIGTKVDHSNISRWKNTGIIRSVYHKPLLELAKKKGRSRKLTEKHLIHGKTINSCRTCKS